MTTAAAVESRIADHLKLPALFAVVALYVPTLYRLADYGWRQADYSHGWLIFGVFMWLLWKQRAVLRLPNDGILHPASLGLFVIGLLLYAFGSATRVMLIESFSAVPVFLGCSGFLFGRGALKALLFPAAFLLFLVPPPAFLIDMITSPLKVGVAAAAEKTLALAGYHISRAGVTLSIGDYSIVVGDACSGVRSMISLMAVGVLYAHLQPGGVGRKLLLSAAIIPIAICANIIRLIVLALVTFHFGEAAGQGFFHDFSGFVLFIIALGGLIGFDLLLDRMNRVKRDA